MIARRAIAAALVAAAPLAAGADTCPTSVDLVDGIRLTDTNSGFHLIYKRDERGLAVRWITEYGLIPDEHAMLFGHPLTPTDLSSITNSILIYEDDTAALSDLPALGTWATQVQSVRGDEILERATFSAQFTGFKSIEINTCPYNVWKVILTIASENGEGETHNVTIEPDLGLILSRSSAAPDGSTSELTFDQIAAE